MDKKKRIIIIAIAAIVVIAGAVTAAIAVNHGGGATPEETSGEPVYVEVTDENGEPVTDENGEVVTELVTGGNTADNQTTDKANTSDDDKNESTSAEDKTETTAKQTIKKPAAPKAVTGLKISSATADSIEISWNKVDCDGYQVSYSEDNVNWKYYPEQGKLDSYYTKTSMKFTKLEPAATYYFSVRAYNKNTAGTSTSAWSETVYGNTKNIETARQITFQVTLPMDSNMTDTLELWIDDELVYSGEVSLNGATAEFTTDKEYKGKVTAWAGLKKENTSAQTPVGGYKAEFDLTSIGIDTIHADEEL